MRNASSASRSPSLCRDAGARRRAGRQRQRLHDPRGRAAAPLQRHAGSATTAGCGSCSSAATGGRSGRATCSTGAGGPCIPGLIDAHGHVMGLGMGALLARPLRHQFASRRRRQRIRAYAAANPTPRWIVGRGWNQERWGLGRFPTAADLDAAVARPAGLARAGRRPCRLGEQRGDARGRDHRRDPGAGGRPDRADRAQSAAASSSTRRWRWSSARCRRRCRCQRDRALAAGAGDPAFQRHHRRRRHGHQRARIGR